MHVFSLHRYLIMSNDRYRKCSCSNLCAYFSKRAHARSPASIGEPALNFSN